MNRLGIALLTLITFSFIFGVFLASSNNADTCASTPLQKSCENPQETTPAPNSDNSTPLSLTPLENIGSTASSDTPVSKALNYLRSIQKSDGSISDFSTSSWAVMAIAAAGEDPHNWKGSSGQSIIDYLIANRNKINTTLATDLERFILSMTAAKEDPRNIAGTDYVALLKNLYSNGQIGSPSALNDDFWGVIALVSAGENVSSPVVRDTVNFIKAHQNSDGGWGWAVGVGSDVDDTAAAIMALMAAREDNSTLTITKALQFLRENQQPDGGFPSHGVTNSASDSWAICAIYSVGQNPADWKVNGISALDHLLSLQNPDGSFNWTKTSKSALPLMTSYAIVALCSRQYPVNGLSIYVRIEGNTATVWRRKVFVSNSIIVDNYGEQHYLKEPTALGALDKASEIGGFEYKVRETALGLYVYSIAGEEASGTKGWLYRVDYYMPNIGTADFILNVTSPPNPPHRELLFYYGEWTYLPLKITVDKTEAHIGENITVLVTYYNDTSGFWQPLEGATVHFLYRQYFTNATGYVSITVRYDPPVWAEKSGFVRSDAVEVKILSNTRSGTTGTADTSSDTLFSFSSEEEFSWRRHRWIASASLP